ncbi:36980_t:CDS:2, partial [Gigaspora margarita]
KESDLTDVALLHTSEKIVTEVIATTTEGKNIVEPNTNDNNSNLETNQMSNNEMKDDNNSEKDLMDLSISDEDNLEDLVEAKNQKCKNIETYETGNLLPPLEDKLINNLEVIVWRRFHRSLIQTQQKGKSRDSLSQYVETYVKYR